MNNEMILRMSVFYLLTLLLTACSNMNGQSSPTANLPISAHTPQVERTHQSNSENNKSKPKSRIRQIDFSNFIYSRLPTGKCSMKKVKLINGKYDAPEEKVPRKVPSVDCWSVELGYVDYGDVTGDNEEEAFVVLYAELGGNSSYLDVFIYTMSKDKPILLWKFMTGDRADGGLRRIYAENGSLFIELYGSGTVVEKLLESNENVGACCPEHYTQTEYKWNGKVFLQNGKEKILSNDSGSTKIIMPRGQ